MPIEKLQVIHRFGILTEARRDELVQRHVLDDSRINQTKKSPRLSHNERTEEMVHQLNSATTEIQLLSLEDEAAKLLQKVKFQISTVDSKNGISNLNAGWKDLTSFISCKSRKIQDGALNIFQKSLCDAPLSKSLLPTLLDTALSNIQELLKNERSNPWERKYFLLCEVIFLICSRLYYHYLVQDLNEVENDKLEELYLLNKALNNTITQYQDNPILQNMIAIISCMITATCPAKTENEDTAHLVLNDNFQYVEGNNSVCISGSTDITLEGRASISSILWNCLKLWKSVSRQKEVEEGVLNKLRVIDFSTVDTKHNQWLDYILAFYTLCESSKLNIEYLRIFLKFRTKLSPKSKPVSFQRNRIENTGKYDVIWSLDLIIIYLRCLADVCMHGISISTQTLALLGDDKNYGLIDYLTCVPDYEDCIKVRVCAYQLLSDAYSFYQSDPMKDGLKNITWNHLLKFRSTENSELVQNVICNYQIRTVDPRQSIVCIFSKIATNLCIMAFSSSFPRDLNSRNIVEQSKRRPKNSKCFETQSKVKNDTESRGQTHYNTNKPREEGCWLEVQRIAEEHFENELEEDEREREILQANMREEEEIM